LWRVLRASTTSWLGLIVLAACRSALPPLDLPAATPHIAYQRAAARPTEAVPLAVAVEWFAVRPGPTGPAVDLAAATIAADRGRPFRGASSLPAGSRWLHGDQLAAWRADASQRQSRGTAEAVVAADLVPTITAGPGLPELELLPATADTVQVVVIARAEDGTRERMALAPSLAIGAEGLLFVPVAPSAGYGGEALLVAIRGPAALAQAAAVRAAAAATHADAPPADWQLAQRAIGEHKRRPALLALARERASARCLDLLLVADEAALITITEQLALVAEPQLAAPWPFERAVLLALVPRLERDELGPALRAALRRQLGALGNDAGTLRQLLTERADLDAFAHGLRDENLAALADRATAPRVAAHDWLQQHGGSVPDYDPMAPATARRAALRAHAAAAAKAAAAGLATEGKQ
jgi:hypothetical protein